jgi:signal transduction histidine kinase
VRDILRGLAAEKRTKVEIEVDPAITGVVLDPSKLKQVLYNYLSNAIKFTPEAGGGPFGSARRGRRNSGSK